MKQRRVIFFDVGNTLLFPNREKILAPIAIERHPTLEQWQALERKTKTEFDHGMQDGLIDHGFWWIFHTYLLDQLGESVALRDVLVQNTRNSASWNQILPGTHEALQRIGEQFRIAVISNSDGRIDRVLSHCGIADCFESITDSGNVGVEKPRREIFETALRTMNARAEESLYVGDVYSVDYLGARNGGMDAVLFDVASAYKDRDLPRVESLAQLETWLKS
ncbi:MAG: HAD family hydrolase [Candidatus Sulfotelmatobacter sp.]